MGRLGSLRGTEHASDHCHNCHFYLNSRVIGFPIYSTRYSSNDSLTDLPLWSFFQVVFISSVMLEK